MRIRTILKVAAVPAIIAGGLLGTTLAASASTLPGAVHANSSNASITQMTGKNAISYNDPYLGPVRCDEVHHAPGKNGQSAFDSISCTSTTGAVLGTVTGGQDWTMPYGWYSDFPGAQYTPNATIHVSDDGMSYTATITYPGATS